MDSESRLAVSFSLYNAYKSKTKLDPKEIVQIKIEHPLSRPFPAWVTAAEADFYARIVERGEDFWDDEFAELDFTRMDSDDFDRWHATL